MALLVLFAQFEQWVSAISAPVVHDRIAIVGREPNPLSAFVFASRNVFNMLMPVPERMTKLMSQHANRNVLEISSEVRWIYVNETSRWAIMREKGGGNECTTGIQMTDRKVDFIV